MGLKIWIRDSGDAFSSPSIPTSSAVWVPYGHKVICIEHHICCWSYAWLTWLFSTKLFPLAGWNVLTSCGFENFRVCFIVDFSWKKCFLQCILLLVSALRSIAPLPPPSSTLFLSLQSKQTGKQTSQTPQIRTFLKVKTQETHTYKTHRNTTLETIIYKPKTTKTQNAQTKQYETKHLQKYHWVHIELTIWPAVKCVRYNNWIKLTFSFANGYQL